MGPEKRQLRRGQHGPFKCPQQTEEVKRPGDPRARKRLPAGACLPGCINSDSTQDGGGTAGGARREQHSRWEGLRALRQLARKGAGVGRVGKPVGGLVQTQVGGGLGQGRVQRGVQPHRRTLLVAQGHPRESGRSVSRGIPAQRMSRAGPWWWSRSPTGALRPPSSFSDSRCADLRDPGAHVVTPGAQVSESRAGRECGSPGRLSLARREGLMCLFVYPVLK